MWCVPELTDEYRKRMEDVLKVYERPYDPDEPVICFDEKSKQLLGDIYPVEPCKPGRPRRRDSEYNRTGTANVFAAVEPKGGKHFVRVTKRRTRRDTALFLKRLSKAYPNAKTLHLVMDNLNTHQIKSFLETFGEMEGSKLWSRFTIHHTPKHGSWLNQAEIEIGLLSREAYGKQRFATISALRRTTNAWTKNANRKHRTINWKFNRKAAREKFKYQAPVTYLPEH